MAGDSFVLTAGFFLTLFMTKRQHLHQPGIHNEGGQALGDVDVFLGVGGALGPGILGALLFEGQPGFGGRGRGADVTLGFIASTLHNRGHHQTASGGDVATDLEQAAIKYGLHLQMHRQGIHPIILLASAGLAGQHGRDE